MIRSFVAFVVVVGNVEDGKGRIISALLSYKQSLEKERKIKLIFMGDFGFREASVVYGLIYFTRLRLKV